MASMKSVFPLVILIVLMSHNQFVTKSDAQSCSSTLSSLNICAPSVVPGASTTPSSDCCAALQSVDRDCMCNTLRIASQIPTKCNLPPLNCGEE
ncbi:hypothetical protein CDL12_15472 [Handroanthus impetiginosus]|uniref:Bifunctional inhibitor/plant lipid transfer protein/seed storage helical domain-containing protein n=1 Tax=Handroanthus impetiginosus TaxID=429701 RepID=A0A2G9H322_9LAMI|nr:hypothetical protein CDL12_15472 [Handroanthus impetiginosus]